VRIALFTDTFEQTNGVARTLARLLNHCCTVDYSIDIYTYGDEGVQKLPGGSTVYRYCPTLPISYYPDLAFDVAVTNPRLVQQFRGKRYDLVHLATPGSMGLIGYELARQKRLPILGSYHTQVADYVRVRARILKNQLWSLAWSYVRWFYNKCSLVLAPSYPVKTELEKHLAVPVGLFPRGVDTEVFHPRFGEPDHDRPPRILYVGRLAAEKNLQMLIDVFREIPEAAVLQIVGDGPLYPALKLQEDERIEVPGAKYGEELSRIYASSDIFAFPSLTDTFGIVVLEALSSELPCVVMNQGGPKEIVTDGHDGFVAGSPDGMRERLRQLIADERLRREMGLRARRSAESRSWEAAFADLFASYSLVTREAS
jgi:glycosyltransferase involved in cell wall biosynthesis